MRLRNVICDRNSAFYLLSLLSEDKIQFNLINFRNIKNYLRSLVLQFSTFDDLFEGRNSI